MIELKINTKLNQEDREKLNDFYKHLQSRIKYHDPDEIVKIMFRLYSVQVSAMKSFIPITAIAIVRDYDGSFNNPFYTTDIISNLKAIVS